MHTSHESTKDMLDDIATELENKLSVDDPRLPPSGGSPAWDDVTSKPTEFMPSSHTHLIQDITSLQSSLDNKAASSHTHDDLPSPGQKNALAGTNGTPGTNNKYVTETDSRLTDSRTPASHTHLISEITNLQTSLDGKAPTAHNHDGVYSPTGHTHNYAPTSHTHAIADTTNLQTTLDSKAASNHNHDAAYSAINHTHAPTYATLANGATAMQLATTNTVKVTPTANATFTSTVPPAGTHCYIIILTSGVTSRTITFGTGFKPTATLATGTVTARVFVIGFISDGTNLYESSRTVAMAA